MPNPPGYDLGVTFGKFEAACRRLNEAFTKGFADGLAGLAQPVDPLVLRERASIRKYRAAIRSQRAQGRHDVKQYAAKTRKELGL